MQGNLHVPFLGGWVGAIPPGYPADEETHPQGQRALSLPNCGIANATLEHSAAYLQSWMRVLRHDATLLVHAAAQAQRAADYIQNLHTATGTLEERSNILHH